MGELVKVLIKMAEGDKTELQAQFNPKDLKITKSLQWGDKEGAKTENPGKQFLKPSSSGLACTLYFDTYETKKDVYRTQVSKLEQMVTMIPSLKRPPMVIFQWNKFTFRGVITSLTQNYTMFLQDGTRCRCEVSLEMQSTTAAASALK